MKKMYYLLTVMLVTVASGLNAQQLHKPILSMKMDADLNQSQFSSNDQNTSFQSKSVNVLWEEDFESTTTGGVNALFATSNGDYIGAGADSSYWSSTSNGTNPVGAQSEMNDNYLRWNSYTSNSDEASFSTTPVNGGIRTPVIDLSSATNNLITMAFNTASMYCCHPQEFPWSVSVSLDGGNTFGNFVKLDFGVDRNVYTNTIESPLKFVLNLEDELDADPMNNNEVVIEFRWVGDNQFVYSDGGIQYNTHYFWDIDDIVIYEKPDYDVVLTNAWTEDIVLNYEYSEVPLALANDLTAQAALRNDGYETPSGVELSIDVLDNSGNSVAQASGGTLSQNFATDLDTITLNTGINLNTLGVGVYTVKYEVLITEADKDATNNIKERTVSVTNNTYAAYNADMSPSGESPGYFYSQTAGTSVSGDWGNAYVFPENMTLYGVELAIHPGYTDNPTTLNENIELTVYQMDNTGQWVFHQGPYSYSVTEDMISSDGSSRHLFNFNESENISDPVELLANELYLVAFSHFGGVDTHLFFWGTPFDDDNSLRFRTPDDDDNWYTGPLNEPIMALNFDETLNLDGLNYHDKSFKIYPNPATDITNVEFALEMESQVRLELRDLSGKLVYSENHNSMDAGSHRVDLNTSYLNSGMYICSLITESTKSTKKIVIK